MDEGLIYSIPKVGGIAVTYDHGVTGRTAVLGAAAAITGDVTSPATGFTKLGRRVWGVQTYGGRLYYAVYFEDKGRQNATEANEIWSIGLVSGANPFDVGSIRKEFNLPVWTSTTNYSNPVASIAFSETGKMLLAERTKEADFGVPLPLGSDSHQSRVLEYQLSGSVWVQSAKNFFVGDWSNKTNCAGGADFGCESAVNCVPQSAPVETVVATGDALNLLCKAQGTCGGGGGNASSYGIQIMPAAGNTAATVLSSSVLIDLDGFGGTEDKTQIGDIDVFSPSCTCMEVLTASIECAFTNLDFPPIPIPGKYTWTFTITKPRS